MQQEKAKSVYQHPNFYTVPRTWHPHIYDKPPSHPTPFSIADILGLSHGGRGKHQPYQEEPEDWSCKRAVSQGHHGKSTVSMPHHVNGDHRSPRGSPEGPAGPTPPPETDLPLSAAGRPHSPLINVDDSELVIGESSLLLITI